MLYQKSELLIRYHIPSKRWCWWPPIISCYPPSSRVEEYGGHTKQCVLASSRRIWNRVIWTILPDPDPEPEAEDEGVRESSPGNGLDTKNGLGGT